MFTAAEAGVVPSRGSIGSGPKVVVVVVVVVVVAAVVVVVVVVGGGVGAAVEVVVVAAVVVVVVVVGGGVGANVAFVVAAAVVVVVAAVTGAAVGTMIGAGTPDTITIGVGFAGSIPKHAVRIHKHILEKVLIIRLIY